MFLVDSIFNFSQKTKGKRIYYYLATHRSNTIRSRTCETRHACRTSQWRNAMAPSYPFKLTISSIVESFSFLASQDNVHHHLWPLNCVLEDLVFLKLIRKGHMQHVDAEAAGICHFKRKMDNVHNTRCCDDITEVRHLTEKRFGRLRFSLGSSYSCDRT
jgi:hypothetical protein